MFQGELASSSIHLPSLQSEHLTGLGPVQAASEEPLHCHLVHGGPCSVWPKGSSSLWPVSLVPFQGWSLRYWVLSSALMLAPQVLGFLSTAVVTGAPQLLWVPLLWMVRLAGSEQGKPKHGPLPVLWHYFSGWKPLAWPSVACSASVSSLMTLQVLYI